MESNKWSRHKKPERPLTPHKPSCDCFPVLNQRPHFHPNQLVRRGTVSSDAVLRYFEAPGPQPAEQKVQQVCRPQSGGVLCFPLNGRDHPPVRQTKVVSEREVLLENEVHRLVNEVLVIKGQLNRLHDSIQNQPHLCSCSHGTPQQQETPYLNGAVQRHALMRGPSQDQVTHLNLSISGSSSPSADNCSRVEFSDRNPIRSGAFTTESLEYFTKSPTVSCSPAHPNFLNTHEITSGVSTIRRKVTSPTCRQPTNVFELNEDLQQKKIELLERSYGGHLRSHHAARIIQSYYRAYRSKRYYEQQLMKARSIRLLPIIIPPSAAITERDSQGSAESDCDWFASHRGVELHRSVATGGVDSGVDSANGSPPISSKGSLGSQMAVCTVTGGGNTPEGRDTPQFRPPPEVTNLQQSGVAKAICVCCAQEFCTSPSNCQRKRKIDLRVGVTLFNKNPSRGIEFLIRHGFVPRSPVGVARFLRAASVGIARVAIGDYLGLISDPLATRVGREFMKMVDMHGKPIDVAIRDVMSLFHPPGESQKINHLMTLFQHAYVEQNRALVASQFQDPETVGILAYSVLMLHTDLHNHNIRKTSRMTPAEFVHNNRGIDGGSSVPPGLLLDIYGRLKDNEFKTSVDHTDEVLNVYDQLSGPERPTNFVQPHRKYIASVECVEVHHVTKPQRHSAHCRVLFLFNDMLIVTKAKGSRVYQCRNCINLLGVEVYVFESSAYHYGVNLRNGGTELLSINMTTSEERNAFTTALQESICEVKELDKVRIENSLAKHQSLASIRENLS